MSQRIIQQQQQEQKQQQRLTQQQMQVVRLVEMPLAEFEDSVRMELDDNPALETSTDPADMADGSDYGDTADYGDSQEDYAASSEREDREDALEMALAGIGRDDEMPAVFGNTAYQAADNEEMVFGNTTSFYDKLKEQMGELELTDQEQLIMEYLIGSLDGDGYLRKSLDSISDELYIRQYTDISVETIERVLEKLQTFDPAGIGARTLQECLLLQIARKEAEGNDKAALLRCVVADHYQEFIKKHWHKIQDALHLSDAQLESLQAEVRKLNPKPGAALGEAMGRNLQQITPDFIVDTADDGTVTFSLNRGQVPELTVSPSFADMVDTYKNNREGMSRQEKEALLYAKQKVERAQGFIEAIRQRRHTLYITMKAIIDWQRRYFQEGDEAELKPMILKDIADKTGLDISTISRVSNMKYAQTRWGTFPLRHFFSDGMVNQDGEELSTRKVKVALRELIGKEDKKKPMSDEVLTARLKADGYPVARRTVAKYREQMGIPVARLRKG